MKNANINFSDAHLSDFFFPTLRRMDLLLEFGKNDSLSGKKPK